MAVRKVNHHHNIKDREDIKVRFIKIGDMVEFKYSGKKIYDKLPIVFILDVRGDNISGININYLKDFRVQQLLQEKSKWVAVPALRYNKKLQWYEFYEKAMRTYKKNKMKMVKKVTYEADRNTT
mgnify:CR=1 FL=1